MQSGRFKVSRYNNKSFFASSHPRTSAVFQVTVVANCFILIAIETGVDRERLRLQACRYFEVPTRVESLVYMECNPLMSCAKSNYDDSSAFTAMHR